MVFSFSADAVIKHVPSPTSLTEERIESLLSGAHGDFHTLPESVRTLKEAFQSCRSCAEPKAEEEQKTEEEPVPTIAFVAKMFIPAELPKGLAASTAKGYMSTIGWGRVFLVFVFLDPEIATKGQVTAKKIYYLWENRKINLRLWEKIGRWWNPMIHCPVSYEMCIRMVWKFRARIS